MAFRLPDSYPIALEQAQEQKRQQQEVPVAFGYTEGKPQRFAGAKLTGRGLGGEFGTMANQDANTKGYLKAFVNQWTSGPFAPEMGPSNAEVV